MKSFHFLSIACIVLALIVGTSCDEDEDETAVDPIVGTWEHVEAVEGFSMTVTMTFNADLTGTSIMVIEIGGESETVTTNFTYSTNGSTLTLIEGGESVTITYSISGNKLILTEDGEAIEFTNKS